MISLWSILTVAHLIGLALGLGAATAKLVLLLRCKVDRALLPAYLAVARPVTRLIILGLVLLTLSGVGWLLIGYGLTPVLVLKLALVATIWCIGPIIDHVVEPEFRKLAPGPGGAATPAFIRIERRYLVLEASATSLFYIIVVMWVLS